MFPTTVKTMASGDNYATAILRHVLPANVSAGLDVGELGTTVVITFAQLRLVLRPLWAGQGFPADVKRVASTLKHQDGVLPVVVAREMSEGAKRFLAERQLSWADAAGCAEIAAPEGFYLARLRPTPLRRTQVRDFTWSPSVSAVAEYVLSRRLTIPQLREGAWDTVDRVGSISEATEVSYGQVAKALSALDAEGYTAKVGPERGPNSSREIRERSRLLSDWAGNHSRVSRGGHHAELHVPWRDPLVSVDMIEARLGSSVWATSGWVAADAIAPFTTSLPDLLVYVPDDDFDAVLERLAEHPEVTPVERGGRIRLRSASAYVFEFAREINARPVLSPVRVYRDLIRLAGRGADAAEHLREVAIGF